MPKVQTKGQIKKEGMKGEKSEGETGVVELGEKPKKTSEEVIIERNEKMRAAAEAAKYAGISSSAMSRMPLSPLSPLFLLLLLILPYASTYQDTRALYRPLSTNLTMKSIRKPYAR